MKAIYIVYKTDTWHSYASRDLIAVSNSFTGAVKLCKKQARKENGKISKDELFNLNNIKQTQGYSEEGEFVIEELEMNVLF